MNFLPSHHRFSWLAPALAALASLLLSGCVSDHSGGHYPYYKSNGFYHGYARYGYHAPNSGYYSSRYWHGGFGYGLSGGGHYGRRH